MSQSWQSDISKLQNNIRKLNFRTKVIEAETGLIQSNLYQASNSFDGAVHAFQACMSPIEHARTRQAEIDSHTIRLILDPEMASCNGTVERVTNLITQETIRATADKNWLESMTFGDFAVPLPDTWEKHKKTAQKNCDYFAKTICRHTTPSYWNIQMLAPFMCLCTSNLGCVFPS